MRAFLVGSYGAGNLGDEALKEYFLNTYKEVDWAVASAYPKEGEYIHLPVGIRSLFKPWWRTVVVLRKVDVVVFGGGSLFTDTESVMACIVWWWYTVMLRMFRNPIHFAFQGVGPFQTKLGGYLAHRSFRHAASISVRDSLSLARVQQWKLNTEVVLTFDPIFKLIEGKKYDVSTKNVLVIIPRMNSGEAFIKKAKELVEKSEWEEIRIISLQPEHSGEQRVCLALQEQARSALVPVYTIEDLVNALKDAKLVLAERYHGALAALALGKECEIICQRAGDKLSAFSDLIKANKSTEELLAAVDRGEDSLRKTLSVVK